MKIASPTAFAGAVVMLAIASPALAHAHLVKSDPAANATVHSGSKTITLTFDDKLVPTFSKFTLSMPGMGMPVKTAVSADGRSIVGTLPAPLPKGSYTITWNAASDDGHKTSGTFRFKVG